MISIKGKDKAEVLSRLFNASGPQGFGVLHFQLQDMSIETARQLIGERGSLYFDYLQGRVLKVDLEGDELDPWAYDRDNGQGAAARALEGL